MQEKINILEKTLDDLWKCNSINNALASDLTIYICDIKNDDNELDWSLYKNVIIHTNTSNDLANLILLDRDYRPNLYRFLNVFIKSKNYEPLFTFFDRAFISHVCDMNYSSKNANMFSMAERSFDRFIEAVNLVNMGNEEILPLLVYSATCYPGDVMSKWKRPCQDYLVEYIIHNKDDFINYVVANFDDIGIKTFDFYYTYDNQSAIQDIVKIYQNMLVYRPLIRSFLKQHGDETLKVIDKFKENNIIDDNTYIDILLIFSFKKDIENKLIGIYRTTSSIEQKKKILDKINITIEKDIKSLAQFNRTCNRYAFENVLFLGKNLNEYSSLTTNSGEKIDNATQLLIYKYKNLCSAKAFMELRYFNDYVSQASLDTLCDEILQQFLSFAEEEDCWVITLLANNYSLDKFSQAIIQVFDKYKKQHWMESALIDSLIVVDKKIDELVIAINKAQHIELLNSILHIIHSNCLMSTNDYELLCDKLAIDFDLDSNGIKMVEQNDKKYQIKFNNGVLVVYDENGNSIADIPDKLNISISHQQKLLTKEISKQAQRLEKAFYDNRKWNVNDFDNILLKNPILRFNVEGLLWAHYQNDTLFSVFKVEDGNKVTLLKLKEITQDCEIGIFHPIENSTNNWLEIFTPNYVPFNQLQRDVFSIDNFKTHKTLVARFNGMIVNGFDFVNSLSNQNWRLGVVDVYNKVNSVIKVNKAFGIIAEIEFTPVDQYRLKQEISLGELRFYRIENSILLGKTWKTNKVNAIEIPNLQPRYFSDIIYEISQASKKVK